MVEGIIGTVELLLKGAINTNYEYLISIQISNIHAKLKMKIMNQHEHFQREKVYGLIT